MDICSLFLFSLPHPWPIIRCSGKEWCLKIFVSPFTYGMVLAAGNIKFLYFFLSHWGVIEKVKALFEFN